MFGYVTINRPELKVKDLDTYQAYYCGVCRQLRRRFGMFGALSLNYDMTFLALLLSSLYEEKEERKPNRCLLHPFQRRMLIDNEAVRYAADMNFMIAYHDLMDDWYDDRRVVSCLLASWYKRKYRKLAKAYPRQRKALVHYVRELHRCEKEKNPDPEKAAALTGEALAEIYVIQKDMWAAPLRQMGYALGKFIYLMDAYEDAEKDIRSGSYNPLLPLYREQTLEKKGYEYLRLMMGSCCRAFELLPILEHADLLRNILYSGVWMKFSAVTKKRHNDAEGKKKHGSI